MNFANLDPSTRRMLALILPVIVTSLNGKLGLNLTEENLKMMFELAMVYIGTSNAKAAVVSYAENKGTAAAATIMTPDAADKQLAKSMLFWLLVPALALAPTTAHAQDGGVLSVQGQPLERPVPDAPKLVVLSAGQPAPADGRWVSNDAWIKLAQRDAQLEAENGELKSKVSWPLWVPIVAAVVGAGLGAGVVCGITKCLAPKGN